MKSMRLVRIASDRTVWYDGSRWSKQFDRRWDLPLRQ